MIGGAPSGVVGGSICATKPSTPGRGASGSNVETTTEAAADGVAAAETEGAGGGDVVDDGEAATDSAMDDDGDGVDAGVSARDGDTAGDMVAAGD